MPYYYWDPTYILVLIGALLSVGASALVNRTFNHYSSVYARSGLTGAQAAQKLLHSQGIYDVQIQHISGKMAAGLKDTVVLAISKDLPFAHSRFCTTEGIENVIPLSDFRFSDFDESYGVRMADGPLAGLLARAVVVIGKDGKVAYTELVPEITQEPDYDKALAAL